MLMLTDCKLYVLLVTHFIRSNEKSLCDWSWNAAEWRCFCRALYAFTNSACGSWRLESSTSPPCLPLYKAQYLMPYNLQENILITNAGRGMICDFGKLTVILRYCSYSKRLTSINRPRKSGPTIRYPIQICNRNSSWHISIHGCGATWRRPHLDAGH
jgi:hypothetical protein